jgi:glycosyltransferase involved in cell wall biosynthesis
MRVVFVNRFFAPDESATSRVTSSLAFALAKSGVEVHVVTGGRFHDGTTLPKAADGIGGVVLHRAWSSSFGRIRLVGRALEYLTFHVSAWWQMRRLARSGTAVIACTDPPLLSVTAMLAVAGSGALLINWNHDLFPEAAIFLGVMNGTSLLTRLSYRLRDASLRKARWNVVPTQRMAELLTAREIPPSTMSIMPYWSDGKMIRPIDPAANALRRAWGLEHRFVVGYSGNFGRVHEFETILDAAEALRDRGNIAFLFIGDGHRRAWVESEAQRRRLDNVLMRPLQPPDRLAESLSVPDLHLVSLLPNLEPCSIPSKLYGILAAGRPTLFVGDLDGEVARIITAGSCGAAVAVGDSAGLARRIVELAGSSRLVRQMGASARRLFEGSFDQEIGVAKWRHLLSETLPSQTTPRRPERAVARRRVRPAA